MGNSEHVLIGDFPIYKKFQFTAHEVSEFVLWYWFHELSLALRGKENWRRMIFQREGEIPWNSIFVEVKVHTRGCISSPSLSRVSECDGDLPLHPLRQNISGLPTDNVRSFRIGVSSLTDRRRVELLRSYTSLDASDHRDDQGKRSYRDVGILLSPFSHSIRLRHFALLLAGIFGGLSYFSAYAMFYCLSSYCLHRFRRRFAYFFGFLCPLSLAAAFTFGHFV